MTYKFKCKKCKEKREVVAKMAEAHKLQPKCCGKPMRRVYDTPAISFKGKGFYSTDNRKEE